MYNFIVVEIILWKENIAAPQDCMDMSSWSLEDTQHVQQTDSKSCGTLVCWVIYFCFWSIIVS
jgi:hypothetical protein